MWFQPARAYLAEKGSPEHPRELTDDDCITLTPWETPGEWLFSPAKRVEKFPVRSRFSVTTAETALGCRRRRARDHTPVLLSGVEGGCRWSAPTSDARFRAGGRSQCIWSIRAAGIVR